MLLRVVTIMIPRLLIAVSSLAILVASAHGEGPPAVAELAAEVRGKGWIIYPARSKEGDWDLYLMRPDGSHRRPLTSTPQWSEAWPQFSRDGSRLLYRQLKAGETISGNRYGEQGKLILANSDGTNPCVLGAEGELPWATWSPDGKEIATLSLKGIRIVEIETGKVVRTLKRQGFFQQLTWSPDGKWLIGVANSFATGWSIARMEVATGAVSAVNTVDCCTPDWFPDTQNVIFSWRPPGQKNEPRPGLDAALADQCGWEEPSARLCQGRTTCLWKLCLAGREVRHLHRKRRGERRSRTRGRAHEPHAAR